MSDFLSSSKALQIETLPWLASQRKNADSFWQTQILPTRKTEDWKYTNLKSLSSINLAGETASSNFESSLADKAIIPGLLTNKLVFVNGSYDASLSDLQHEDGLELIRFSEADASQQQKIEALLSTCVDFDKHPFAALNTKCVNEGVYLSVSAGAVIEKPIHVVNLLTGKSAQVVNSRLLVQVEKSASVSVIEHFASAFTYEGKQATPSSFSNSLTECIVGENAELSHYRLMEEDESVHHISGVHTLLRRSSRLNSFYLALGTQLTRVDVSVTYEGEGAEAEINGVYLPQNKQHVDFHTCIEHAVPNCTSNETFRGIISDNARAVFNGRIHIHKDAQKTEAYLSNKNLLTSNKAEVDTKPELEIYADDVRCAHGATVAQLEESAMHYLKTRGISEDEAQIMLSFGFINELLGKIKLDAIGEYCRPKLAHRFSRDENLIRHIR